MFPNYVQNCIGPKYGITITTYLWEEQRGYYTDPNQTIQEGITGIADSALVVFVFYNKLGEGVNAEFEEARKLGKRMLLYRKEFVYSSSLPKEQRDKFRELEDFWDELPDDRYFKNVYTDVTSLQDMLDRDISLLLEKLTEESYTAAPVSLSRSAFENKISINTPIPMNNKFVGRVRELDDLTHVVNQYDVVAVYGMGGMGKTSMVAKYCRDASSRFNKIIWMPYHNSLEESILALNSEYKYQNAGRRLGFGELVAYLNSIEGEKLIVIDNFDIEKEEINQRFDEIQKCFPTYKKIITTRTNLSSREEDIYIYNLEELKREEAILLFKEYYKADLNDFQVSDSELSKFLDVVNGHTLIVELVAKTLKNHFSIKMSEILGYIQHETDLPTTAPVESKWHNTSIAIKDISSQLYNKEVLKAEESELLEILAILCEEHIDLRYLMEVIDPDDKNEFEILINRLSTNGWINKAGFAISCHRILADIILDKARLNSESIDKVLRNLESKTAFNSLDDIVAKRPYYQMQRLMLRFLSKTEYKEGAFSIELFAGNAINFFYNGSTSEVDNPKIQRKRPSCKVNDNPSYQYLMYAKEHCHSSNRKLCHINECISDIYSNYYKYDAALELLKETERIENEICSENTIEKARTSYSFAKLYNAHGQTALALTYLKKSYEIYSDLLGESCIENLDNCLLFISIFDDIDLYEDAKKWAEKAKEIIDKANVAELNPRRVRLYLNLSVVAKEEKLSYITQAEELAIRIFGDKHPELCEILIYKGLCYADLKDYSAASLCFEKWYEIDVLHFGDSLESRYVRDWLKNIILFRECRDKESDDVWQKFIDSHSNSACETIGEKALGIRHLIRYDALLMAYAYDNLKQYDLALKCYKDVLNVMLTESYNFDSEQVEQIDSSVNSLIGQSDNMLSKLLGSNDIADVLDNMLIIYMKLKDKESALKLIESNTVTSCGIPNTLSNSRIQKWHGIIALLDNDLDIAQNLFEESIKNQPEANKAEHVDSIVRIYMEFFLEMISKGNYLEGISALNYVDEYTDYLTIEVIYNKTISLAHTYKFINEYFQAECYYKEAINIIYDGYEVDKTSLADTYDVLGECLIAQEKYSEAIEVLFKALEIAEQYDKPYLTATIYHHMAQAFRAMKDYTSSEAYYRMCLSFIEGVEEFDNDALAAILIQLASVLYQQQKSNEAIDTLLQALHLTSEDQLQLLHEIHSSLGYVYRESANYVEAEMHYRECIPLLERLSTDSLTLADAYDDLGAVMYANNKSDEAIAILSHALDLAEQSEDAAKIIANIHFHIAHIYNAQNDWVSSEEHFRKYISFIEGVEDIDRDMLSDILLQYASVLIALNKNKEAIDVILRVLSLLPENNLQHIQELHLELGRLYNLEGDLAESEKHYADRITVLKSIADIDCGVLADAYDDLGTCMMAQEKYTEARNVLSRALEIAEHSGNMKLIAPVRAHLAQAYSALNDYPASEKHYRDLISFLNNLADLDDDQASDILLQLSSVLIPQEKNAEAIDVLHQALHLTAEENIRQLQEIHLRLAYLYRTMGDVVESEKHYRARISLLESIMDITPVIADAYDDLGAVLFSQKKFDEANDILNHAYEISVQSEADEQFILTILDHLLHVNIHAENIEAIKMNLRRKLNILEKMDSCAEARKQTEEDLINLMLYQNDSSDICFLVTPNEDIAKPPLLNIKPSSILLKWDAWEIMTSETPYAYIDQSNDKGKRIVVLSEDNIVSFEAPAGLLGLQITPILIDKSEKQKIVDLYVNYCQS